MSTRRTRMQVILLLSLVFCGCGLFTSCSREDNPVVIPDQGTAFRAMLKSLDWGTDTTFVYGHKTPDVDAVCSSLGYARLMRALGYNCKAKVSSATNRETAYISGAFGFALPELKPSVVPQTRLIPNPDESDPNKPFVEDGFYFIYYGAGTQAVAETIFGPSLREGVTYSKENLVRKQIVPKIIDILQ